MDRPSGVLVFCVGCVGAIAPEVVRLYQLRRAWNKKGFSPAYWMISAAFAALGGVMAVILPAVNLYAAFYAGATMPVTISAMARHKDKGLVSLANCAPELVHGLQKPAPAGTIPPRRGFIEIFRSHADGLFDD